MPGYPLRAQRRQAVKVLRLRPGDTVVDIACGTGQNFPLIERVIGPQGQIVGVDLTDAMLAQAQRRIERNGWTNIELVQQTWPTSPFQLKSTRSCPRTPCRMWLTAAMSSPAAPRRLLAVAAGSCSISRLPRTHPYG